jgi:ribosomal protein L36
MLFFKFTDDQIIKRLRWVMVGTILFSVINTLLGQPDSFWHHPETAIRGDGLSIYNATNYTFDFFIGSGWGAYLITCFLYISLAFLIVSVLPKRAALITIFSFILAHFFGATNWLAVRWHFGTSSASIYGLVLSPVIVSAAFPKFGSNTDKIIKRFRWVMVAPMVLDLMNTLIGQPSSYWLNPETVYEGNPISRYLLIHGWYTYLFVHIIFIMGLFWLVRILPKRIGLICIFFFIFGGFVGASCWFFYVWRMGMQAPVIFGLVLSIFITLLAFPDSDNKILRDVSSEESAASQV